MGILPKDPNDIEKLCSKLGGTYYIDPTTGRKVLTSYFLKKKGSCCNSGCRHCPYKEKEDNEPDK